MQVMSYTIWFHLYLDFELGGMYDKDHQNPWNYHPKITINQYTDVVNDIVSVKLFTFWDRLLSVKLVFQ